MTGCQGRAAAPGAVFAAVVLLLVVFAAVATAAAPRQLEAFVRDGCPHCAAAHEFLAVLAAERPELVIVERNVTRDAASRARLAQLARAHGVAVPGLPAFLVDDRLLIGFDSAATTGVALRSLLDAAPPAADLRGTANPIPGGAVPNGSSPADNPPVPPVGEVGVTLFGYTLDAGRLGLVVFSLALGLVDGFNPCSMWVLVLMLAMLAPLRDRRRMLLVAGTFVLVEGIAYFAFMAAWLNTFVLIGVSRAATVALGLAGIVAGLVHVKDFIAPDRGFSLSIPASARPGIYARLRRVVLAENTAAAIAAAALLAAVVQAVELLCTAGIPALFTRVVELREPGTWHRYAYLALYDLAYMFDDMVVLGVGVATLSQRRLQANEGRWLKLLAGVTLIALGSFLLLREV